MTVHIRRLDGKRAFCEAPLAEVASIALFAEHLRWWRERARVCATCDGRMLEAGARLVNFIGETEA